MWLLFARIIFVIDFIEKKILKDILQGPQGPEEASQTLDIKEMGLLGGSWRFLEPSDLESRDDPWYGAPLGA